MGLPQDNAAGYRLGSPINFAEGLKGKLLVVHGSGDDNVHYQGTERLVNRLVADTPAAPGGSAELSQRVMLIADPRSNSIVLRSDNPGRVARIRQLIEQLDTPQRAGGNVFIIYLKNADAARVAETLRGLYGGGTSASGALPGVTQVAASLPTGERGISAQSHPCHSSV